MLRIMRLCERLPRPATACRSAAVLALAMATGGCSAGFEMPSLSYSGGPSATSSAPIPREPVYQNRSGSLGDASAYGQSSGPPSGQSYGQRYGQPYGQPYGAPSDGGGAYSPPYDRQGASQSPYQPPYSAPRQAPEQQWRESNRGTPVSPEGERGVRVASLPDDRGTGSTPTPRSHDVPPAAVPYRSVATTPVTAPVPPRAAYEPSQPSVDPANGQTIEVVSGDTLFALSKKHGVPVSELMRANNLKGPQLRIGQKLVVPSSSGGPAPRRVASLPGAPMAEPAPPPAALPPPVAPSHTTSRPEPRLPHHEAGPIVPPLVESDPSTPAATPASAPAANSAPAPRIPAAGDESGWTGTYTVAQGDSLYAVARKHSVRLNELERVNKITDPRRVKPGTVLKVPRAGEVPGLAAAAPATPSVQTASAPADAPSVAPTIINTRTRTAALTPDAGAPTAGAATDASPIPAPPTRSEPPARDAAVAAPQAAASVAKFRWPARGKIISNFGPSSSGQNDGINIALPRGADVHAAEAGIVTYAGDGVQGYGNLLLIRHDGGWITAYAHNDSLNVKSGEAVKRGQVIAKAGATGSVDTPQLRFEIRQGVKPVDPVQHLER